MNEYWKKTHKVYELVNNLYPKDIPSCSKLEAGKAYRILLFKFGRKKHSGLPYNMALPKLKRWSEWNKGWWKIIHMASHRVFRYRKQYKQAQLLKNKNDTPNSADGMPSNEMIESMMNKLKESGKDPEEVMKQLNNPDYPEELKAQIVQDIFK